MFVTAKEYDAYLCIHKNDAVDAYELMTFIPSDLSDNSFAQRHTN